MPLSFNRTIVELKYNSGNSHFIDTSAFNRTIVELKLSSAQGTGTPDPAFNRTIVELKFKQVLKPEKTSMLLIVP